MVNNDQLIEIRKKLLSLSDCETPQIFRKGLSIMNMQEWRVFLKEKCHFEEDKRHFNFDGDLNSSDWWEISYQPEKAVVMPTAIPCSLYILIMPGFKILRR